VGVLDPELFGGRERVEMPSAVPSESSNCRTDFSRSLFSYTSTDGGYHALVGSLSGQTPVGCKGEFGGGNEGTATVPQYGHLLLQTESLLSPEAVAPPIEFTYNLYDSVAGQLHLISVLPDGTSATYARFAGNEPFGSENGSSGFRDSFGGGSVNGSPDDISADGSRVFWTTVEEAEKGNKGSLKRLPEALYMRVNGTRPQSPVVNGGCSVPGDACTVQLDAKQEGAEGESGGGVFRAASSDGSKVFFTDERRLTVGSTAVVGKPDLYEYEASSEAGRPGSLINLTVDTKEPANVAGVLGASKDGSYVYFAAGGALTTGKNAEGREPVSGNSNFYVFHDGVMTFIATADDGSELWSDAGSTADVAGDLLLDAGHRTAGVTPDGRGLVFRSHTSVTGYNSLGLAEVFVYRADTGRVSCASCAPSGAPPSSGVTPYHDGAALTVTFDSDFMFRWISEDGGRVFFVTGQPLVSVDTNRAQDVYEWERPASGSEPDNTCTRSSVSFSEVNHGCVFLLSGGTSSDASYFLDASASGNDVFIRSRAKLAPQSVNENMALYDVRVGGGFSEARSECTGTGCQGVPPPPPIFATPSSVTFNGVGNFPPVRVAAKNTKKKIVKCAKGKKRSHGRCVKRKVAKKASRKHAKRKGGKS
jgi:hypothetical protein